MKKSAKNDSWDNLEPDMELVKQLLSDPAHKDEFITDLALDAGFFNLNKFNEIFKEETGMCPREYRSVHIQF